MPLLPHAGGLIEPTRSDGRPVSWAATGRSGGVSCPPFDSMNLADHVGDDESAVGTNRARLARALGLAPDRLALTRAVHGRDVALAQGPGVFPGFDALITTRPDLAVVAVGADCLPMALVGADGRTVAAVHCGWRGLVAGVVDATIAAMRASGTEVALAILGPTVCGRCYPVPTDRADQVRDRTSDAVAEAALVTCPDGQPGIDVRAGVVAQLAGLGLPAGAIVLAGGCTVEDPGLFSYRRDGVTGRQGIAICTHSRR